MRVLALALATLFVAPGVAAQVGHPEPGIVDVMHTPLTTEEDLARLAAINPEFADVRVFGSSLLGLDLWLIDIHHPDADPDAMKVIYIDGNHHGNEQYGGESMWFFARQLMDWSLTPEGADRLSEVRFVIAPIINADGTLMDKRTNTNNVDLNRNYPYHWGLYGTDDNPAGLNYRGASPGSEPETQVNVALMDEIRPDVYISTHTGSHDIVLPWRAEMDGAMPDWPVYEKYLAGIEEVSGLGYRDPSGAGESISYAYGALGAISIIPEVDETQFELVAVDLETTLQEEIAIYWYTLEVLESLGGHLEASAGTVTNSGWGNATNVTFYDSEGTQLLVVEHLGSGASMQAPADAARVEYERREQGDLHRPVWSLDLASGTEPVIDRGIPMPWWIGLGAVVVALVVARRRPA